MLSNLLNIILPKLCYSCSIPLSDNENSICTKCRHQLPVTNYHKLEKSNPVEKIFHGRVLIEHATSLLRFEKKGITQQLIHQLKYKGHQEIGAFFGNWLGEELSKTKHYTTVNCIIPVPLHKKKLRKRGYNQVTVFAQAIASHLNATFYDDVLVKSNNTASQVTKNRLARWNSENSIFSVINTEKIAHKHILLVDDLITTGATLEACIQQLKKIENVKISIATIATA